VELTPEKVDELQATITRRLNIGCGQFPLAFWLNLDRDPLAPAEMHTTVPPIPAEDSSLDEIYAGHFLEHLNRAEAREFLRECYRCLAPGGRLGLVVPDTREILTRYLAGSIDAVEYPLRVWNPIADLDAICGLFLYSTVQETPHKWSYEEKTLSRLMEEAGFVNIKPICRYTDPRLADGAWWQCGCDGWKPS
jgi:predicted SAM-dependent methyltransferase